MLLDQALSLQALHQAQLDSAVEDFYFEQYSDNEETVTVYAVSCTVCYVYRAYVYVSMA